MPSHPKKKTGGQQGQVAGGPRQKLMQVMRASGVSDKAAANLTNQALGAAPSRNQPKAQPKSLRKQLIGKLREIGAKARTKLLGKKKKKKKSATPQPKQ